MTILEAEAVERARRVAGERGWRWEEPVRVTRARAYVFVGRVTYEVRTNADALGCNARVVVDGTDGSIIEAFWLPR